MNKGKEYELLVDQIYKELKSGAQIVQNDSILGKHSGINRQIDVSLRFQTGDIESLVIIEVKDVSRKADVKVVDAFISVMRDVCAHKGILIAHLGFTKAALNYAKNSNIELYSAHQAFHKKWHLELVIPVFKYEDKFEFDFRVTFPAVGGEEITMQDHYVYKVDDKILTIDEFSVYAGKLINFGNFDKSGKKREHILTVDNIQCNVMNNCISRRY